MTDQSERGRKEKGRIGRYGGGGKYGGDRAKNGSKREGEGEGDRGKESWEIIVSFPSTLKLARASSPTFFFPL